MASAMRQVTPPQPEPLMVSQDMTSLPRPERAGLAHEDRIVVRMAYPVNSVPNVTAFRLDPPRPIHSVRRVGRRTLALHGGPFDMRADTVLYVAGHQPVPVLPDRILDRYRSTEPLGWHWVDERTASVRLFHPRGDSVDLHLYDRPDQDPVVVQPMALDERSGCWTVTVEKARAGQLYGFRVNGPADAGDHGDTVFCDPYGWVVAKSPGWPVRMLSVVPERELLELPPVGHCEINARDLMIYEAHVKDVTQLAVDVPEVFRGRYLGVSNSGFPRHVQRLGLNAVEFLPLHVCDDREPPFGSLANRWNETSRNHWGYMSVQFFAPEPRYATGADPTRWQGTDTHHIHQVRRMVRHLHERGITVILDVVYNHVGNYGLSPLRRLDPRYWLRVNGQGQLQSGSGCGNDLWTERPMARRMIVDSLLHWSRLYGIDGFRFDLAGLLDDNLLDTISTSLRNEHPAVHLIAEPWGGRYDKRRFAVRGWSCWNDHFRDGLRGHDAHRHHGALFGGSADNLTRHIRGSVAADGGPFDEEWQSVNYLASHDDYNLGDFIRVASKLVEPRSPQVRADLLNMPEDLLATARLGYFSLFISRGMLMIHQGDEWARAKVVEGEDEQPEGRFVLPRKRAGELDRDSYNRDDRTNWIDWSEPEAPAPASLMAYVAGLAAIRREHKALRLARHANSHLLAGHEGRTLALDLRVPGDRVLVILNLETKKSASIQLPKGVWRVLANEQQADPGKGIGRAREAVEEVGPMSARLMVRRP